MKKRRIILLILSLCVLSFLERTVLADEKFQTPPIEGVLKLRINNRPLAKINGEVISLLDVVKRMDAFLYERFPGASLSDLEKAQFYLSHWEHMLEEMICNQLVLLDASQKELQIGEGQVHEELENRFGPHTALSLDQIGLSFKEACDWIRSENIMRQMMWYKVHAKALHTITPQLIKEAYQAYLDSHPPTQTWTYQVLSMRGIDKKICDELAAQAYQILSNEKKALEEVAADLQGKHETVSIALNRRCSIDTSNLSEEHYEGIKNLAVHACSEPISQVSRVNQTTVTRIFYLEDRTEQIPSDFETMHESLKNKLIDECIAKEKKVYFEVLKKRYGFDKTSPRMPISEDYEPFALHY